jgi:sigma-54 specific flagellar transcriptional regulator A
MSKRKVLLVEDSEDHASHWCAILEYLGYESERLSTQEFVEYALLVRQEWVAALIGRIDANGRAACALQELCRQRTDLALVFTEEAAAVGRNMDLSGYTHWFLDNPLSYKRLAEILHRASRYREELRLAISPSMTFGPGGHSPAITRVRRLVERVAPFDTSVLVLGESGTGKERVARHVHELSRRADRPFVPVNCGAIPVELLESELFGHEKGAFTGAISTRVGRFEYAEGGTLFLDEIGDMSMTMQVKLLRVLQERSFERVGSNLTRSCDVRIIAATHRNLERLIELGQFREDLYYRLNVFPIQVPALRERTADLPDLIEELGNEMARTRGTRVTLADSALEALGAYAWPGNVRELANLLERLAIMCPDRALEAVELPARYLNRATEMPVPQAFPAEGINLKDHLANIEVTIIRTALDAADGTIAKAARLLRLQRTTLVEKLRKYQIAQDARVC